MILYPAIDILDNRAVRLLYGDRTKVTDYGDPLEVASRWIAMGAEYLHIVDLNAAFNEPYVNTDTLRKLLLTIFVPVQVGGGIRTMEKLKYYLDELGVSRVIIGTAAALNDEFINEAAKIYKDRIVAGIDVKDNKVAVKGWLSNVDISPLELALKMKGLGINTIVYTDISRDGALSGVNAEATLELKNLTDMEVIASGGISSMDDLIKLKKYNIKGAILGKSIYSGSIDLGSAINLIRG